MRLLALLFLTLSVLSPTFAAEKAITRDSSLTKIIANFANNMATIAEHVAGYDLKVTVKASSTADGFFKEGFRWGGEDSTAPTTLITSVVVQSGANKLFVPLSAYSDLGDPHQISLKPIANGFELAIAGGDAGVSYNAVLVFEKGWLIRRQVVHGEFPDEAWESTQYAYNTLDN